MNWRLHHWLQNHWLQTLTMRRALLLVISVALVPLLLLQAIIYWAWFRSEQDGELLANVEIARALDVAFEGYVREISRQEGILTTLSTLGVAQRRMIAEVLKLDLQQYDATHRWSWIGESGLVVVSTDLAAEGKPPQHAAVLGQPDTDWLAELHGGKSWLISDLWRPAPSGPWLLTVARRVSGPGGKYAGAVAVEVEADKLGNLANRIRRTEQGTLAMFDRRGQVAFCYPPGDVPDRQGTACDTVLRQAMADGREAAGRFRQPDGVDYYVARVPSSQTGWIAGAGRPVSSVLAGLYGSLWRAAAWNLLVVVISVAGAAAISRRIINRLRLLQLHARAISNGDMAHRSPPAGIVELDQLAATLNRMSDDLQTAHLREQEIQRHRQQAAESLRQAVDELARSNKELLQFGYVASHDLQEPLRVIIGYLQLIETRYRGKLDGEGEEFINFVIEAAHGMQQLITDLLEYSRVGSRGRPLEPTDAEAALRQTLLGLKRLVSEHGAAVSHDGLPTVMADRVQLVQIFQHLIANAIKFRGSQSPQIRVSAQADGDFWQFAVADNGIGIEQQYWDKIFVIFQRLHARDKYPGTGIGLAICQKIIERHGGRMWVQSVPGTGSTFFFTLAKVPVPVTTPPPVYDALHDTPAGRGSP